MKYLLTQAISYFFDFLNILIVIRVLLSWIPISRDNPFIRIIYQLTEPILAPVRKLLERSIFGGRGMMIDFSPIIAYILLEVIRSILMRIVLMG